MNNKLQVLVLAGGKSTRFWPLTDKLRLSFLGKSLLEHQLNLLSSVGLRDVVVVGSREIIENFAGEKLTMIEQKGEGQGAAILSAAKYIKDKPVLIVNANDIVDKSLLESLLYVTTSKTNMLVGFKSNTYFPGGYLVLEGKKIVKIHEKPGEGNEPSSFVRLVFDYFVNGSDLLKYLESHISASPASGYEESLTAMMTDGITFEMLEYENTWIQFKYPWHALSAMGYYLGRLIKKHLAASAQIHKTVSITGLVHIEDHVRVMEYAKLVGPLYIGAGTIIGNHSMVRGSMIGENSVIGFGCDVTRSYVGNDTWFHSNYIGDSVIGNNVAMGAGAVLANLRLDEGEIYSQVKHDRVNTNRNKLGSIIGEGARIGVEAQLMPGVKVGRNSVVGPGVILTTDIEDNKRVYVKQELMVYDNQVSNIRDRAEFKNKIK